MQLYVKWSEISSMNILHQTLAVSVQLACQIVWCHFLSVPSGQWEQSAECAAERIPAVPALQPGPEGLYRQPQIPSAAGHTSATGQLMLQCSSGQTFQRLHDSKSYNLFSLSQNFFPVPKNSFIFKNFFSFCKNFLKNCSGCVFTVCVCSLLCVYLDGLNAEHKFRVWVTILGHTPLHFHFIQNYFSKTFSLFKIYFFFSNTFFFLSSKTYLFKTLPFQSLFFCLQKHFSLFKTFPSLQTCFSLFWTYFSIQKPFFSLQKHFFKTFFSFQNFFLSSNTFFLSSNTFFNLS